MEMKNIKKVGSRGLVVAAVSFGLFILMIGLVSSFAVGSKYWEENPLVINPGETVDFFVVLQNVAGEGGDVNVQGTLTEGGDIAKFTGDSQEYFVPFGEKRNVNLSITILDNMSVGEIRDVVISFKIISGEGSDALGLGSSIERTIPIKIVQETVSEGIFDDKSNVWIFLFIIIVLAVTFWVYKKRYK